LLTLFVVPSFYFSLERITEHWTLRREAGAQANPAH
jgi:hypothetical protein